MATWCFVRPSTHLLFDRDRYFFKLPVVSAELVALAANIFCLSFFVGLGIGVWRRSRSARLSLVLELLFLGLLIFPADYIRVQYFGMTVGGLGGFVKSPVAIAFLVAALAIFLWKHRLVARGAAVIISLTFPAAFWSMAKIVLLCLGVAHLHQCAMDDPPPPALFPAQ